MYICQVCGKRYLTAQEASLCTPRSAWPLRYPERGRAYQSAFGPVEKS